MEEFHYKKLINGDSFVKNTKTKQKMWCLVNLPNGATFGVKCDPKSIGQECLEKVCQDLNIVCETDYFGLLHCATNRDVDSKTKQWINLRNPLFRHTHERGPFHLALRVKFWVPAHLILQESARNLFYMQARSDLLEKRLVSLDWENSAKLGALLAQADEIKFNPVCLTETNVLPVILTRQRSDSTDAVKHERRRPSKRKSSESRVEDTSQERTNDPEMTQRISPLRLYESYIIYPEHNADDIPENILTMIAKEHEKLDKISMPSQSAKYWLLAEISKLNGFGEEIFNGITTGGDVNAAQCEVGVGPHGLVVYNENEKLSIPFSAVEQAKSQRRTFRLTYLNENHVNSTLEIKLPDQQTASGLYRGITEKHAFYSCETVRSAVTAQFIRDLKGTIASMFNEDTELGKRYVFDIQRTCREVHDTARRVLHSRGIEIRSYKNQLSPADQVEGFDVEDQEKAIERAVAGRITEAWTCKICMDNVINTMFSPCGHVMCCKTCADKCERCPLCRADIVTVNKIFLPTELCVVKPEAAILNAVH